MKKPLTLIKIIFSVVGIGMLIGAYFFITNTLSFLETAKKTEGEVVELIRKHSSNNSSDNTVFNSSYTYAPLIKFTVEGNRIIEFVSTTSSNPPAYTIGEKVEIVYDPRKPESAEINSFFSLWGGGLIFGGLGIIFSSIGFGIIWYQYSKKKTKEELLLRGESIYSTFKTVEYKSNIKMNGRSPYQIISQWQNPTTSKIHVFTSENIWFDPKEYITTDKIKVYIDINNPQKYYMDISFLPELSE